MISSPTSSDPAANQTRPCPGSRFAISSVKSWKPRSSTEKSVPVGACRSAPRQRDRLEAHDRPACRRRSCRRRGTGARAGRPCRRPRAGAAAGARRPARDGELGEREARRRVGHRDRAGPQRLAVGVADDDVRRRPEPVLVERVAADRERVVDPDRLLGDLLAVLVDGEVGREVARLAGLGNPGASNPRLRTRSSPGVPIGWTVSDSPSATTRPCSSPRRAVTAAATRNRTSPLWLMSVASLTQRLRSP